LQPAKIATGARDPENTVIMKDIPPLHFNKNSSGDEIANVNFFYNIAHVEASAYAH